MSFRRADGVHTSVLDQVTVPEADLVSFVFHNKAAPFAMSEARLKATALIDADTGITMTFSQLIDNSIGFARTLASVCKPKEVVFIISANNFHTPTVVFGTLRAGLAISPCNPAYVLDEVVYQLKDCKATAIVTAQSCASMVAKAAAEVGISKDKIFLMPTTEDLLKPASESIEIGGAGKLKTVLGAVEAGKRSTVKVQEGWLENKPGETGQRVAYLCYSSGTTGRPKGVMTSHRNLVASLTQVHAIDGTSDYKEFHTRAAGIVPMYHIFGLTTVLLRTLLYGGSIVIIQAYQLRSFLTYISKYGCTLLHLVPPQLLQLAKEPIVDEFDLSKLERIFCAAAPYSWDTVRELQTRLKRPLPLPVKNAYGMTESSPVITQCPSDGCVAAGRSWVAPEGSCGMVPPNTLVRLVDPETGKDAALGKDGEVWFSGPQKMMGYLNNPKANEETFVGEYMRTGDIAVFDKDGFLFITDRLKELIKTNGFQVAPSELESILLTHPKILDVAVIGIPDERAGQLPKAYVVPKQGQSIQPQEIQNWIQDKVAPYKRLRGGVELMEVIPKSPSGKILRRVLTDMEKERAAKLAGKAKL